MKSSEDRNEFNGIAKCHTKKCIKLIAQFLFWCDANYKRDEQKGPQIGVRILFCDN